MTMNSAMGWAAYLDNICSRQQAKFDLKLQSLDAMSRMGLYVDVIRTIDIESVRPPQEVDMDVDVGRYVASVGLNGASAALLCKLPKFGFPIRAMREEQWGVAFSILRDYGSIELIRRAATFVRAGFAKAKRKQQQIVIEFDKGGFDFASDKLERSAYDLLGMEPLEATNLGVQQREIDALMEGCLRPWRTKFGTFIGYDASPEIDEFYLALAEQQVYEWVDAAGFLPKTRVNRFTWEELTSVLVLISSIRVKHVNFVRVAKQTVPDLEILSSFTIWGPKEIKISEISWATGISAEKIHDILRVLYLQASEGHLLRTSTNTIHPLGVDFENGYYLYPVCGAFNNPITNLVNLMKLREPSLHAEISAPREDWLRKSLYGLFQGERFHCVDGNIRLRRDGKVLTDVDAAIFDAETNSLALFQLKWQDFGSFDARELVSKAKNLIAGLNTWVDKVESWEESADLQNYRNTFRISGILSNKPFRVYNFGICKNLSRIISYADESLSERISLANWPQFVTIRHASLGSADIFRVLYSSFQKDLGRVTSTKSFPITLRCGDERVRLENLITTF